MARVDSLFCLYAGLCNCYGAVLISWHLLCCRSNVLYCCQVTREIYKWQLLANVLGFLTLRSWTWNHIML